MEKKTKKKVILINSSLLIFMIIGVVFAWFASNFDNSLDSNDVTVVSDNTLELSIDNSNWSTNIQLSNYGWFNNIKFTDVTGSGNGTFLRPTLEQHEEYASVVNDAGKWTVPKASSLTDYETETKADYAKFTLYMRSKDPLMVYLGENSSVKPMAGMDKLVGSAAENVSSFSTAAEPFSKDVVVGAVRISATNTSDRLFTWIPRPDVYCLSDSVTRAVTAADIKVNETINYSLIHSYYGSTSDTSPTSLTTNVVTGDIFASRDSDGVVTDTNRQLLATMNSRASENDYFVGRVDFYIWIEGCDNEARRAFVDGKFRVNLNITSEDTTDVSTYN